MGEGRMTRPVAWRRRCKTTCPVRAFCLVKLIC